MKITKGHYNRKLLTFGVMLFLAIALISTGFAAWIMSSGAEKGFEDENISVGVITEVGFPFLFKVVGKTTAKITAAAKTGDAYVNIFLQLKLVFGSCFLLYFSIINHLRYIEAKASQNPPQRSGCFLKST